MAVTAGLCVLLLLALRAAAQGTTYFEIGKGLKLDPKHPEAITSITWKHKSNIVAEYIKNSVPVDYLGDFKGRSAVNLTTGILTVSDMVKSDDGKFTVEINNKVLPVSFDAVGVRNLKDCNVEVIVRPLTCNSEAQNCNLSCGVHCEDAGPFQSLWKKGDGDWLGGEQTFTIFNEEEKKMGFRAFSCRANNTFSEKESSPLQNPFSTSTHSDSTAAVVAGVLVPVLILIIAGGGWLIYKKMIKTRGSTAGGQGNPGKANGEEQVALK